MMRALYTAATGMLAQQANVDNISNNLSNVNTVGYKTEKTEFKSLLYQTIQTKTTSANGEQKPISAQTGLGTRVASTTSIYTQGAMLASDNDTDFAIVGDGFFAVRGADGETYYTRAGNFTWSIGADGNVILTNTDGYPVLDTNNNQIALPAGISSGNVKVASDGSFGYTNAQGVYVSMNQSLGLFQFRNAAGLEKIGDNLLAVTDASGEAQNEATQAGLVSSQVRQNYLEGSNVQVADEMVNLIIAQRAYQLNSKAITTSDEMLEQANNLKR
jgi:flagellar basal-body rod protein FlgG